MNSDHNRHRRRATLSASSFMALGLALIVPHPALAGPIPFVPVQSVPASAIGVFSSLAADIDGDGDLDLVAAAEYSDRIAWYENTSGIASAWTERIIDHPVTVPLSIAVGDVDGDGDLDVLAAVNTSGTLAWYENLTGDGTSWLQRIVSAGQACPDGVFAGDVDGDGDLDALASLCDGTIGWFENLNGAGTFGSRQNVVTGIVDPRWVSAADVDGDGDLDALVASGYSGTIDWYENLLGDGSTWVPRPIEPGAGSPERVYAADLDGDGDDDILSAEFDGPVSWYENLNGAGVFATRRIISSTGNLGISIIDADGDGDLDVLHGSFSAPVLAWAENDGATPPGWTNRALPSVYGDATTLVAADLDGDGDADYAAIAEFSGTIDLYENRTIHRSASFPTDVIPSSILGPWTVRAADLNADGNLDLLSCAGADPPELMLYLNDGSGDFSVRQTLSLTANGCRSIDTADMDEDGDLDVLSASEFSPGNKISWYENSGVNPPGFTERSVSAATQGARSVFAADVDGDGDMDVLTASLDDDTIAWHENDGGSPPGFTRHTISVTADGARSVFAADLDRDGHIDVVSASGANGNNKVAWYENDGSAFPGWTEHVITTTANVPQSLFVADIDGDGLPDILVASEQDSTVAWYRNGGGPVPSFTRQLITTSAPFAQSAQAADLDGDGDLDVLAASYNDDTVAWYESDGAPLPAWSRHLVTGSADGASSAIAADLNGDGKLDIATSSGNLNRIDWYPNRGGQFALATTNVTPALPIPGDIEAALRITVTHRGRPGDTPLQLTTLELLFEKRPGAALTSTEANALIDNLYVYLDNGDGILGGSDVAVEIVSTLSLTAGRQTVPVATGDVNYGTPRTYFVAVQPATGGSNQIPNDFRVVHVTESSSTASDVSTAVPIPLSLEFVPNVASGFFGNPPQVVSVVPQNNSLSVPVGTNVTVVFSEPVNPATVTSSTFRLLDAQGVPVAASVALAPDGLTATLDPTPPGGSLALNAVYTVQVTSGVLDLAGFAAVPFNGLFATAVVPVTGTPLPSVADQSVLPGGLPPPPGPGALTTAAPLLEGMLGPNLGYSVAAAGDLNHDQLADFVGGAPGYALSGLPEAGAVAIYLGSNAPEPSSGNHPREVADVIFTGQAAHDRAGSSVAAGFDFNGDGTGDILIGAEQINRTVDPPEIIGAGKVYLIYFKPQEYDFDSNGIPDYQERSEVFVPLSLVGTSISGAFFLGAGTGDQAGYAVAAGGFLESSDTKDDVVIGAPGAGSNDGKVYVVFSGSGVTGKKILGNVGTTIPGAVYLGSLGERLGSSVALPGDVTAPVGPDIAIGAPLADTTQLDAGRVYVAAAGSLVTGTVNAASIPTQVHGDQACEELGFAVAGGGDNRASGTPQQAGGDPDLLIGAPYFDAVASPGDPCLDTTPVPNAGRVIQTTSRLPAAVIGTSQVGSTLDGVIWRGVSAGGGLGWAVGRLGDLSGNRLDDIGLSAPFVSPGTSGAGAVYVIEGSANTGLFGSINADQVGQIVSGGIFLGTQIGEEAGLALCAAGDLDGDGLSGSTTAADFAVGSPGWNASLGTVHQVLGTLLQQPGECTALGCTVAELATGAVLVVPPNAIATGVKYRFAVSGSASSPTACGSHTLAGKSLVGVSNDTRTDCGTPPCAPPGFAIGPNIEVPTQQSLEYQLALGEPLALRYCDSTLGWRSLSSGPTTGLVQNNTYVAGRRAVAASGVDTLRLYGVFFDDLDHDDVRDTCDCSPGSAALWSAPGPADNLLLAGQGATTLTWTLPGCPGGSAGNLLYDTIRSTNRADFVNGATCVEPNGTDLTSTDEQNPPLGQAFYYIVSPENGCATGGACSLPACVQTPARDC